MKRLCVKPEWAVVYRGKDASRILVYSDWLEEQGFVVEAVGWRKYLELDYFPLECCSVIRTRGGTDIRPPPRSYVYFNAGAWIFSHSCDAGDVYILPANIFDLLQGYEHKNSNIFVDYITRFEAIHELVMALGKRETQC